MPEPHARHKGERHDTSFPLAGLFILAWSGIPLWMVLKHPGRPARISGRWFNQRFAGATGIGLTGPPGVQLPGTLSPYDDLAAYARTTTRVPRAGQAPTERERQS